MRGCRKNHAWPEWNEEDKEAGYGKDSEGGGVQLRRSPR
jgi:hypothetical protein